MTVGHNNNPALEALIIGTSAAACRLREMIRRVARSNASVMLCGPSGSGKELVARAIHDEGARSGKAFSAINCGAIPGELIESELFGHEKGSFTGAHARRIGHFEASEGGTLFLDEIGDMRFDMHPDGLFYYDPSGQALTLVSTVKETFKGYSKRQVQQAKNASDL